jgi:hypothetical protein
VVLTISMSFCKGITQSGSNADTLLTDAYIKGIQDVPWSDGFEAIRKVGPVPETSNVRTLKSNQRIGESKVEEISVTMIA